MIVLVFLLPIASGALLVHLLWPDLGAWSIALKLFLGVGIGLGINSLSYFLYLSFFAGQHWFFALPVAIFAILLASTVLRWRGRLALPVAPARPHLSTVQWVLLTCSSLIFLISLLSTASYVLRRRQGDWDAWMMFNRAARFVYRDPSNWLQSFSPQMDPIFHADYPLFLAMNIASGWDTLGSETPHVPMVQSTLFAVACAGLFVSALGSMRSIGQAALGLIIIWGTPVVVNEGARELADLPLAYFFLATVILVFLYVLHRKPGLLVLAGVTAGLAAWVKNEGSVFVIAAALAIIAANWRQKPWLAVLRYAAGLAVPLAIVLYFKFFLAPPSDVLSSGPARSIAQAMELSRHLKILRFFVTELLLFGGWKVLARPVSVLLVLLVYLLLVRRPLEAGPHPLIVLVVVTFVIQLLGYYAVYVITPYDLAWHLTYSIERVFLQVFPMLAFAMLAASRTPESIFQSK